MHSIVLVVVDTMSFSYLQGLGALDLLGRISRETNSIAVTSAVVRQLNRSGRLGPLVQSYCDRKEMRLLSPVQGDEVSRAVTKTLRSKEGMLVRRNRVDVELVEVARAESGALLTSERGIHRLCDRRHVPVIDLLVFFAWCMGLGLIERSECDRITSPWATRSAMGTGCPIDFTESFSVTATSRNCLAKLVDLLPLRE